MHILMAVIGSSIIILISIIGNNESPNFVETMTLYTAILIMLKIKD